MPTVAIRRKTFTVYPKRGPVVPPPRLSIDPRLKAAARASGRPCWTLAEVSGFRHYPGWSTIVQHLSAPATLTSITRLYRIADSVGVDRHGLIVGGPR